MKIAIVGGGPGGYEAALVAAELGAEVTLIDRTGLGGACVLWDCVPSKTLCSTAEVVTWMEAAPDLGISGGPPKIEVDLPAVFGRIMDLAQAQSADVEAKVRAAGVTLINGTARFTGPRALAVDTGETIEADAILIATGSSPREMATAKPDGERILNARHVYSLTSVPERLVVVGSGATGAEFAHAFNRLGSDVTLISSRDRMLPGEDPDAAMVLEDVFTRRGMHLIKNARANSVENTGDGVRVELSTGEVVEGSHALVTVGMIPNSADLDLPAAGIAAGPSGEIPIDGVSRTNVPHVYAAGDVTGGTMLASVAAMQGRIAMWHALGQGVQPFRFDEIAATVFTDPEIANVGLSEAEARNRGMAINVLTQPFATNARAKMVGLQDGFVKLITTADSHIVIGGSIVAPHASDLILPVSVAIHARLRVDRLAQAFSIYPSFGGSVQEAARRLMRND
jgi:NAD(P)H dehydrogenase (quinone)